jgi:radical SAM protein with 4Fe4S-binding SPASM domain
MPYSWERLTEEEKTTILRSIAGESEAPPPRVVEIYWQDRCNIDCFFCSTGEVRSGGLELSSATLRSLFAEMATLGVRAVRLSGGGEPLFRKDARALIEELGRRRIRIADLTTNAVLLTEPVVRALFEAGCDEICVSLNTGDAESYAAMMRTTPKNFERVLENVRNAARIKTQMRSDCVLRLQFLIYKENYRQIPSMYRVFRESGADRFWFNGLYPVTPMPRMTEEEVAEMLLLFEEVLSEDLFERLEKFSFWEQAIEERILASTRRVFEKASLGHRARIKWRELFDPADRLRRSVERLHEYCLIGWYSATITARGDVFPCCILQDQPSAALGNLNEGSLSAIWFGPGFGRLRKELTEIMARRGEVGDFSRACVVQALCARKGACPNRSYYWTGDAPFRKRFHQTVESLERPDVAPFSGLDPFVRADSSGRRLPSLPVR